MKSMLSKFALVLVASFQMGTYALACGAKGDHQAHKSSGKGNEVVTEKTTNTSVQTAQAQGREVTLPETPATDVKPQPN